MYEDIRKYSIPQTAVQLLWIVAAPYKRKSALFFLLTFFGIAVGTASPFVISLIINRLTKTSLIDSYIIWLTVLYFVLRVMEDGFWRSAEALMRSFKPQMVERLRMFLFAQSLKKPYGFYVNASSGRIGH